MNTDTVQNAPTADEIANAIVRQSTSSAFSMWMFANFIGLLGFILIFILMT